MKRSYRPVMIFININELREWLKDYNRTSERLLNEARKVLKQKI